ncbi:hypothetical protein BHE74_00027791 [Ensete ventricosum]|nr:hypothetical protein GW17_00006659 [Ensete ventricosum]RWW64930.1 hypothetical protein BHE74_00027791 [Ensete ventricosum]
MVQLWDASGRSIRSSEFLPLTQSLVESAHGLILSTLFQLPNVVGFMFGIAQIIIYFMYVNSGKAETKPQLNAEAMPAAATPDSVVELPEKNGVPPPVVCEFTSVIESDENIPNSFRNHWPATPPPTPPNYQNATDGFEPADTPPPSRGASDPLFRFNQDRSVKRDSVTDACPSKTTILFGRALVRDGSGSLQFLWYPFSPYS